MQLFYILNCQFNFTTPETEIKDLIWGVIFMVFLDFSVTLCGSNVSAAISGLGHNGFLNHNALKCKEVLKANSISNLLQILPMVDEDITENMQ